MDKKPHLLFISSWYPTDSQSAGTFIELYLEALQSRGVKCPILISGETTLGNYASNLFKKMEFLNYRERSDFTFIENLTVHPLPLRLASNPVEKRRANILTQTKKTIRTYISREGKPDVIFHHGVFDYCYLSSFLHREFGMPIWYVEHSPNLSETSFPCANPFDTRESQVAFAKSADRRFAVTKAYMKRMSDLFQVPFEYCPNVIADSFFIDPSAIKKPKDVFQFVNVAILEKRKNQTLILEAFADRFRGNPKFRLVIAGEGKLGNMLRNLAAELGISDQCTITGFQSRPEIIKVLDASHCFVLSSFSETFGVVLIEAMARGIPAISSRIDGPTEIINGDNGLFFDSGDAFGLGERMEKMVANYDHFDPEKIIESVATRFGPDALKKALFLNG